MDSYPIPDVYELFNKLGCKMYKKNYIYQQLRSYVGCLNYYNRFLLNLNSMLPPLYQPLHNNKR